MGYKTRGGGDGTGEEPLKAGEPTQNFLTAIVTQNASESDKPGMAIVALSSQHGLGAAPGPQHVDGAYVCGPSLHSEAQEDFRDCMARRQPHPDRGKVFTVEAFDIKVEERQAICPSGQASSNCSRLLEEKTGKGIIDSNGTAPFVAYVQEGRSASPPRRPTIRWSSANITPCCRPSQGKC